MKITKVTFTGADDRTAVQELADLSELYPFVEWGILFSKNKEGQPRYPSRSKILDFSSIGIPLSAHFCGWHSRSVMEGQNFRLIDELPESFKRIQINYNFHREKNWQVKWVVDYAYNHPERSIIFQANQSNAAAVHLIDSVIKSDNIHFLYDSSGGRGSQIKEIHPPFRTYTGYSGGLSPANVEEVALKIQHNRLKNEVWLDMESGVRTEDKFDLSKAESVSNSINRVSFL
jgi:hypothetical protein